MKIKRRIPRLPGWMALSAVLLLICGGCGIYGVVLDRQCEQEVAEVAEELHTDPQPLAQELAPLGQVLEVHWVQSIEGGKCEFGPGSIWYEREGVARLDPADAAKLGDRFGWEAVETHWGAIRPDPRLLPWMPRNPDWRNSPTLDASFTGVSDVAGYTAIADEASYFVNVATGHVYFSSRLH